MFNFWWSAWLVNGLEPHLPPLSSQRNEMLIFGLHSTSDDWSDWLMDSNPIHHPSPAKNIEPHPPPISSQEHEMLIFGLCSTSDDQPGWSMDSNPVCHLSAAKKMKCSFLDYVQLLMIGRAGRWTWALCAISLQPKKWNAHFWVTFNFWWSARLVDGLEPHLPPICSQKRKCSFLDYVQLLMISWIGQWTWTPSTTYLQPKTWNACFWITFNFWWSARLVDGLAPSATPLQPKKLNPHFWITFNFWWLVWSMDLNPICQKNEILIFGLHSSRAGRWTWTSNLSPAKKMKCSFLDYVQLLMIGRAGRWTWALCAKPKKWNAHFWRSTSDDGRGWQPLSSQKKLNDSTSDDCQGLSIDSNSIYHPSPPKKMKCFFRLHSNSDDLVDGLEPICHPSPAKKMKCSFLD